MRTLQVFTPKEEKQNHKSKKLGTRLRMQLEQKQNKFSLPVVGLKPITRYYGPKQKIRKNILSYPLLSTLQY